MYYWDAGNTERVTPLIVCDMNGRPGQHQIDKSQTMRRTPPELKQNQPALHRQAGRAVDNLKIQEENSDKR